MFLNFKAGSLNFWQNPRGENKAIWGTKKAKGITFKIKKKSEHLISFF